MVVRAEQIVRVCGSWMILEIEEIKCSLRPVLANPGYGDISPRSGMADADMSDKSGGIVLKTKDTSVVDENVSLLTSKAADSTSNLDAIKTTFV